MRHLWLVIAVTAVAVVDSALWGLAYKLAGWNGIIGLFVVFVLLAACAVHGVGADE